MSDDKKIRFFVPEWVPVSNKGEEAIVLGYNDTLFPGQNAVPVVLDFAADEFYEKDGIEVYPGKYFFPTWENREFGLAWSWYRLESSFLSALRHLLDKICPRWILRKTRQLKKFEKTMKRFRAGEPARNEYEKRVYEVLSCDYIVAGHDGSFNFRECQLLDAMREHGFPYGIYGSSLRPETTEPIRLGIFDNTLEHADYIYVRNTITVDWARKHLPKSGGNVKLCPDPAFGMDPAPMEAFMAVVARHHLEQYLKSPLIVMTVCEPAPIARLTFLKILSPEQKKIAHRKLLGALTSHILDTTDARIIFLPHSLGPEKALDDRIVAEGVIANIPEDKRRDRVYLLRDDLDGRVLKRFIAQADLLIGERIHSIIGSVKVDTPFLCIGSNADYRIHGIVESMLRAEPYRYLLDDPKESELNALFDRMWSDLPRITEERKKLNRTIMSEQEEACRDILSKIRHT